jgi:hypothetical protein
MNCQQIATKGKEMDRKKFYFKSKDFFPTVTRMSTENAHMGIPRYH